MIRVRKQLDEKEQYHKMWQGRCLDKDCSGRKTWQFWFFGATLGFGLEHLRRHHAI